MLVIASCCCGVGWRLYSTVASSTRTKNERCVCIFRLENILFFSKYELSTGGMQTAVSIEKESVRPTPIILSLKRTLLLSKEQSVTLLKKKHTMNDIRTIQRIYGTRNVVKQPFSRETTRFIQTRNETGLLRISKHRFAQEIGIWNLTKDLLLNCATNLIPNGSDLIGSNKDSTQYFLVDNNQKFWFMMSCLKKEKVIAVDVEANAWDVYTGIVCLIQISTWRDNFLIDTLAIPQETKSSLGKVLECQSILKIMHGPQNDFKWMQRDFNIFMYPVIDTQLLHSIFGGQVNAGFSVLVCKYLDFDIPKEEKVLGQLSDYTVRPLHQDIVLYAVNDSRLLILMWEKIGKMHFGAGLTSSSICQIVDSHRSLMLHSLYEGYAPTMVQQQPNLYGELASIREKIAIKLNVPVQRVAADNVLYDSIKSNNCPLKVHPEFREILLRGWDSKCFSFPIVNNDQIKCMRCGGNHAARFCHVLDSKETKACVRKAFNEENPEASQKEKDRRREKRKWKRRVTGETLKWLQKRNKDIGPTNS